MPPNLCLWTLAGQFGSPVTSTPPFGVSFASFFVIEDHILHTTQGLVDRAYIDELWDLALSKTIAALRTHSVSSRRERSQSSL